MKRAAQIDFYAIIYNNILKKIIALLKIKGENYNFVKI